MRHTLLTLLRLNLKTALWLEMRGKGRGYLVRTMRGSGRVASLGGGVGVGFTMNIARRKSVGML